MALLDRLGAGGVGALSEERILITGATGFLGGHVVAELTARGYTQLCAVGTADADLTDSAASAALFERERPAIVLHLAAAVGGIQSHRAEPGRYAYANTTMAANVLEQARRVEADKVVTIGTAVAYAADAPVPTPERELFNGFPPRDTAPYAIAKLNAWVMGAAYTRQYGLATHHLVLTNIYGPGDHFEHERSHVVGALVRRFVEAREAGAPSVEVWGSGAASRDFLYVEDAARGIVDAMERLEVTEPINLGAGREVTIRELAETIRDVAGYRGEIVWDTTKPEGAPRRALDVSRIAGLLDFRPAVDLREGLARTVEAFASGERA